MNSLVKSEGFKNYYNHFTKEEEKEIGIITYYMPQMQKIKSALYPNLTRNEWRQFEQHKYENEYRYPDSGKKMLFHPFIPGLIFIPVLPPMD